MSNSNTGLVIGIWALVVLIASLASASEITHPKTFKGSDPKGWGQFHWQMTKEQAEQLGAEPFTDGEGEQCLGLSEVELLNGKKFQVCLKFFSSMGLHAVRVTLSPQYKCAPDIYETFLNDFRETHGKEMETRDHHVSQRLITKATTGSSAPPKLFCTTAVPNPA